ncbi:BnaC06g09940D [Brassica napus]|uniref:Uncharacterized protein n=2 Tax=Brassica TaxID=3705 RepID=A0A3P6GZ88_BRAOL|nr:unnamed protein product [Brassica napus]CDY45925.1 BnaC06g09940D [Brassica napus]VDD61202.1 unnamed protein product [Brassica oleracea]
MGKRFSKQSYMNKRQSRGKDKCEADEEVNGNDTAKAKKSRLSL